VPDFYKEHALETYKSLMQYGSSGIKFVLATNGAAAIAVMTFLGHFIASGKPNAPDMRLPLAVFLGGIVCGGIAIATAYFTQLTLYNESIGNRSMDKGITHVAWLRISIVMMFFGLVAFAAGSAVAVWRLQ